MAQEAERVLAGELREADVECDADLRLDDVTPDFLTWLQRLGPYGNGNREPLFVTYGLRLMAEPKAVKERHLRLLLEDPETGASRGGMAWGAAHGLGSRGARVGAGAGLARGRGVPAAAEPASGFRWVGDGSAGTAAGGCGARGLAYREPTHDEEAAVNGAPTSVPVWGHGSEAKRVPACAGVEAKWVRIHRSAPGVMGGLMSLAFAQKVLVRRLGGSASYILTFRRWKKKLHGRAAG